MQAHLKLLMKGFQLFEQRIIETTVRLSESRSPCLTLLPEHHLLEADIVIIDGADDEAMAWAEQKADVLKDRTVVWVDAELRNKNVKHTIMNRPILWVNLPIILTRVLEEQAMRESGQDVSNATVMDRAAPRAAKGATVLVVDDSQAVRDYLANVLTENGYEVVAVECGEDAVEEAEGRYFDCVLMDVLMPGIDGYKACRSIRRLKQYKARGPMPVIMLTSRTSPFDKIRGKMAGCNAYLTKPVKILTLLKAVDKYVNK